MLQLESYEEHERHLPAEGKFIIGQFNREEVIVYQAFKKSIADYAVDNQRFGGPDYEFDRVTHLKPSFLWMMYYSGWAHKKDQEHVLAITMSRKGFEEMLSGAVLVEKGDKDSKEDVTVTWMSYHDLFGNKTDRMAAKIALRGDAVKRYSESWIQSIEDITEYVKEQQELMQAKKIDKIQVPRERAYAPDDLKVLNRIKATTISL